MTKIVTRLIMIGILTTLCVAVMIASVILINQRSLQDGYIINIVGKERMLSQKITKEIFIINAHNSQDYATLNAAIEEFDNNLRALRFGDSARGINPPHKTIITSKLDSINTQWQDFKTLVENFKTTSSKLYADRNFLYENNSKMLLLSDNIVKTMVKHAMPPNIIDDAGRQRMLTQKMAYLLVRYINNWDSASYQGFFESYNLYDKIINDFYNNKTYQKNPQIYASITQAYTFWQTYSAHINNILKMQKIVIANLKTIAYQNTNLLNQVDWLTNLYSDLSIHSRTYLEKFQYAATLIMLLLALYSLYHLLSIQGHIKSFIRKTQLLTNGKIKTNLAEAIQLEGESELSQASQNISHFIAQIQNTKETSNQAIQLSESISEEVAKISEEIRAKLAIAQISQSKRQSIENAINLGEDIAIQSSEQLIVVARLLEKLHRILKEIEDCCGENSDSKQS